MGAGDPGKSDRADQCAGRRPPPPRSCHLRRTGSLGSGFGRRGFEPPHAALRPRRPAARPNAPPPPRLPPPLLACPPALLCSPAFVEDHTPALPPPAPHPP